MTLSESSLSSTGGEHSRSERVARGVGVALGKCIEQALMTGRLECGIVDSAQLLERCPEGVLLCVLPVTPQDMSDHAMHIHHTLLMAFCVEHGIRCLRVHREDLARAISCLMICKGEHNQDSDSVPGNSINCTISGNTPVCFHAKPDVSCVLVQSPKDRALSFEDKVVLDFHDEVMDSPVFPKPVLSIPG